MTGSTSVKSPSAGSDGEGASGERPTRSPTGLSSSARSRFRSQVNELVHRHPDRPPPGSEAVATATDRLLVDSPDGPSPLDNVRAQVDELIRPPDSRRGADFDTDLAHIDEFLLQVESQSIERQARFERIGGAKNQVLIGILMLEWIAFVVWFWLWWLQPEHQVSPMRTAIDASLLLYVSVLLPAMPALYLTRIRRRQSGPSRPLDSGGHGRDQGPVGTMGPGEEHLVGHEAPGLSVPLHRLAAGREPE